MQIHAAKCQTGFSRYGSKIRINPAQLNPRISRLADRCHRLQQCRILKVDRPNHPVEHGLLRRCAGRGQAAAGDNTGACRHQDAK